MSVTAQAKGPREHLKLKEWRGKITLERAAMEYADLAIETLADVCSNGANDKDRVNAATAILDRSYGTPVSRSLTANLDGSSLGNILDHSTLTTKSLIQLANQVISTESQGLPPASGLETVVNSSTTQSPKFLSESETVSADDELVLPHDSAC